MTGMQDLPDVLAGSTELIKNMGETGTGMPGVMPSSMSQSLDIPMMNQALNPGLTNSSVDPDQKMTSSMTSSTTSLNKGSRRIMGHRNATSQNWFCFDEETNTEGRVDLATKEREREERIRKIKEQQEDERKRKLEELKQHAINAQKFREQQESERRRHIEELRSRDMDRRAQVEERRREIERAEMERREAILAKNKEREERIDVQRRLSRGNVEFAFGSSAPRMVEHRDSSYWGSRSAYERRSAERDLDFKNKRTTSAQGLDRSNEGDENGLCQPPALLGAHRRRTDLMPTIVMARDRGVSTPSTPVATPKLDRTKRARSVTGEQILDDDQRSNSSSTASGPVNSGSHPVRPSSARKTPAQVKAEAAARRAKASARSAPNTPKTSLGGGDRNSTTVSPALSSDHLGGGDSDAGAGQGEGKRQITPDIIKDNGKKVEPTSDEKNVDNKKEEKDEEKEKEDKEEKEDKPEKKIITSEEEAKARIAEKRREMKEKMEREAEAERLRLEEEERLEAERIRKEEEEERRIMEETERIAAEARRAEEERIQKAIQEKEAEEKRVREEEERARKEKEELERKTKEEAERREVELQEKLRKEEEERQARKKRIEEIMARTRGKGTPTSTPKKEPEPKQPENETPSQTSQPPSLDTNVDPTKPDLIGDISDTVQSENKRNLSVSQNDAETVQNGEHAPQTDTTNGEERASLNGAADIVENGDFTLSESNGELEKGALDSLSNKSEDSQASIKISSVQSTLIELENGTSKMSVLENEFEILDLSGDNRSAASDAPQPPIIAFESNSQQNDLLS